MIYQFSGLLDFQNSKLSTIKMETGSLRGNRTCVLVIVFLWRKWSLVIFLSGKFYTRRPIHVFIREISLIQGKTYAGGKSNEATKRVLWHNMYKLCIISMKVLITGRCNFIYSILGKNEEVYNATYIQSPDANRVTVLIMNRKKN